MISKQFDDVATVELGGGVQIPQLGFGTFQIWPYEAQQAVEDALALGYRHIDTAAAYCNEGQVGAALKATGMADRTFVTTKLRNGDQGVDETLRGCEESLGLLGIDAIDLYLIHWPAPTLGRYVDAWKTMVELQRRGLVHAIGVSNFLPEHLERIIEETGVVPAVNQIESHPPFLAARARGVLRRARHRDRGVLAARPWQGYRVRARVRRCRAPRCDASAGRASLACAEGPHRAAQVDQARPYEAEHGYLRLRADWRRGRRHRRAG